MADSGGIYQRALMAGPQTGHGTTPQPLPDAPVLVLSQQGVRLCQVWYSQTAFSERLYQRLDDFKTMICGKIRCFATMRTLNLVIARTGSTVSTRDAPGVPP